MKSPLVLLFGLLSLCAMPAAAQQPAEATGYPARPVKVIVPNAPGAALDIIGRMIAQKLSEATGAQFYVENLPGAEVRSAWERRRARPLTVTPSSS